jgi:hypothetical protein
MYLTTQLQSTLMELDRASKKTANRFSAFNFIKARVSKTVEFYLTPKTTKTIVESFAKLPHKFTQRPLPDNKGSIGRLSQILIDDFTQVLLMIHQSPEEIRHQFINDSHFADEIINAHTQGWSDCCEDCGVSLDLALKMNENKVVLANKQLADSQQFVCAYSDKSKVTTVRINTPSKILVLSDSLNDFLVSNNHNLSAAYQKFVKAKLSKISSASERGKLMTTDFYAKHNIAHFYVGRGLLGIHEKTDGYQLEPVGDDEVTSPLSLNIDSLFLTMMDYSEFTAFCHEIDKSTYQVLKSLNANIVQLKHRNIDIVYQMFDSDLGRYSLALNPAKDSETMATEPESKTA